MNDTLIRELLAEHKATKQTLEASKDKERKLREKIVAVMFPSAKRGTNKISLKQLGLDVKAVIRENWSVKQEGIEELLLDHEELSRAFKTKYDLSFTGYKSLSDEEKELLAEQVTCKDGVPELTYEGDLGASYLYTLKGESGVLIVNGSEADTLQGKQIAKHYGFENAEQLARFLEDLT